jgi:hypothetical protein
VNADCRNIEFAPGGAFVKRLDVLKYVLELETIRRNQMLCQRIKHERIVRVRRVAERKRAWHDGRMTGCPLLGNNQHRVLAAERVLDTFPGVRVGQPLPVHDEEILVASRNTRQVSHPFAVIRAGQRRRVPLIE